jgi:hypothetical protein
MPTDRGVRGGIQLPMSRRSGSPTAPGAATEVTGVATGSLGTGTALDDTQVYEVPPAYLPPPEEAPAAVAPAAVAPAALTPAAVAHRQDATADVAPADVPAPRPGVLSGPRRGAQRFPIGLVAGAAVGFIVVIAVLAMHGGSNPIGADPGGLEGGAVSTLGPTHAPTDGGQAEGGGRGGGQGNGNGKGHGH